MKDEVVYVVIHAGFVSGVYAERKDAEARIEEILGSPHGWEKDPLRDVWATADGYYTLELEAWVVQ